MPSILCASSIRAVRAQKGYGLLEIALGIAIASLLVAGAMMYFNEANQARKANEAVSQATALQSAIRSLYAGQPDYIGLTAQVVAGSKLLPNKYVKGADGSRPASISSPFMQDVDIRGLSNTFQIVFSGVPDSACTAMATMDLGTGVRDYRVNRTQIQARGFTPTDAVRLCTGNNNTVGWTFF